MILPKVTVRQKYLIIGIAELIIVMTIGSYSFTNGFQQGYTAGYTAGKEQQLHNMSLLAPINHLQGTWYLTTFKGVVIPWSSEILIVFRTIHLNATCNVSIYDVDINSSYIFQNYGLYYYRNSTTEVLINAFQINETTYSPLIGLNAFSLLIKQPIGFLGSQGHELFFVFNDLNIQKY